MYPNFFNLSCDMAERNHALPSYHPPDPHGRQRRASVKMWQASNDVRIPRPQCVRHLEAVIAGRGSCKHLDVNPAVRFIDGNSVIQRQLYPAKSNALLNEFVEKYIPR